MRTFVLVFGLMLSFGCSHKSTTPTGGDPGTDPGTGPGSDPSVGGVFAPSALSVTGKIVDFETKQALSGAGTMATAALVPPPNVSVSAGGEFSLDPVPPFSVFYLIAGSPPNYKLTYNSPTTVTDSNLADVTAYVVASAYVDKLRTAFGVTGVSGTTTVFIKALDANGMATTGINGAASLVLPGNGIKGPYYLDTNMAAAAQASSTTASGWMVYFNVPAGTLQLGAGAGYAVKAADAPTVADAVSLVAATITKATSMPGTMNVSFANDVAPVFITRGCFNCHSGNGGGRRLGDLQLDGSIKQIYAALTTDISPTYKTTRVNLKDPAKSLILTMPSYETPPDPHPTVVFASSTDPDYVKILTWIKEGAKFN